MNGYEEPIAAVLEGNSGNLYLAGSVVQKVGELQEDPNSPEYLYRDANGVILASFDAMGNFNLAGKLYRSGQLYRLNETQHYEPYIIPTRIDVNDTCEDETGCITYTKFPVFPKYEWPRVTNNSNDARNIFDCIKDAENGFPWLRINSGLPCCLWPAVNTKDLIPADILYQAFSSEQVLVFEIYSDGHVSVPRGDLYLGDETPPNGTEDDIILVECDSQVKAKIVVVTEGSVVQGHLWLAGNVYIEKDIVPLTDPCVFDNVLNGNGNPVITIDEEGTLIAPGGLSLRGFLCYRVMDLPHPIGYPDI